MLEELDRLDAEMVAPDGTIELVIFDAGLTDDPQTRLELLMQKSMNYVRHAQGKTFAAEHPGKTLKDVMILVVCKLPPTEEMQMCGGIEIPGLGVTVPIQIKYPPLTPTR